MNVLHVNELIKEESNNFYIITDRNNIEGMEFKNVIYICPSIYVVVDKPIYSFFYSTVTHFRSEYHTSFNILTKDEIIELIKVIEADEVLHIKQDLIIINMLYGILFES